MFAGFSNSASLNGDKQVSLQYLQTLASQHGGIWVSLGLLPANTLAATRRGTSTTSVVLSACWCSLRPTRVPTKSPLATDTAVKFGQRVADITRRFN